MSENKTARRFGQAIAIACMALLLSMVAHKAYVDVSALAQRHSGKQFWVALVQYFIGNLAGGAKPASDPSSDEIPPK